MIKFSKFLEQKYVEPNDVLDSCCGSEHEDAVSKKTKQSAKKRKKEKSKYHHENLVKYMQQTSNSQ